MPRFVEVVHEEWIAAPEARVRAQFADLEHHITANVHPKLRFQVLEQSPAGARYVQEVRLLGLLQRDVFERRFTPEGEMVDTSVEGFNQGGSLRFRFAAASRAAAGVDTPGTRVTITIRLPLPPVIGPLIAPLLRGQVRREVAAAAAEDKRDLEERGYPAATRTAQALGSRIAAA